MYFVGNTSLKHFFELIQVSLGVRDSLSESLSEKEWEEVFTYAMEQTILGVCFSGIERLPDEQRPQTDMLLQWIGVTWQIEGVGRMMNDRTKEAVDFFRRQGFKATVLKGQGIAQLYPTPERRQSGDIDIWLDGGRERIYAFAREHDVERKLHGVNYHHIHYPLFDDVEVEVHIYPCCLNNPFLNQKLHRFFEKYSISEQEDVPSITFNRIFILLHCFNHLVGHGVGLRQVMDYYFVLKQGFSEEEKNETVYWLNKLRMYRFAGAMMWLMKEVFGLDDELLLVEPNKKEGLFMLNEICETGNMGHFDSRNWGSLKTPLSRYLYNIRRDIHFITHYPQEIIWQPIFNLWLYLWRSCKGLAK